MSRARGGKKAKIPQIHKHKEVPTCLSKRKKKGFPQGKGKQEKERDGDCSFSQQTHRAS